MAVYAISDLHFDYENVRDIFDRPFDNVDDMNEYMINRWNSTVSKSDEVIFVGDVTTTEKFDTQEQIRNQIQYRFEQLNGDIVLVPGNHDEIGHKNKSTFNVENSPEFSIDGKSFCCQHRPPSNSQDQWVIHGHEHTNHTDEYPFICQKRKTINVSAELLHYTPISIESLTRLIETQGRYSFCPPTSLGG